MIRVASVPENHVYVRHIGGFGRADGVVRLPDPVPEPGASAGVWWPPRMLDPAWVRDSADQFDVFHLHFGFDAKTPGELAQLVTTLRELGKPLVYTVHDLRNPHHDECALHDAQLDVLIPAADELITLTPGAAQEIQQRWGRATVVLPHPYVVGEPWRSRPRQTRGEFVVGVHAKSLRASMAPGPVITTLEQIVPELSGARLRVDVHEDVFNDGSPNHDPVLMFDLESAADRGALDLRVHDCFSDVELWDYFRELDVSVLPYRFGTHSGWLEACYDLGTTVAAPDCGYFAWQRPCLTYHVTDEGIDRESLTRAIVEAYDSRPAWRAVPDERDAERRLVAQEHRFIYERVTGRHPAQRTSGGVPVWLVQP